MSGGLCIHRKRRQLWDSDNSAVWLEAGELVAMHWVIRNCPEDDGSRRVSTMPTTQAQTSKVLTMGGRQAEDW